ncbi:methyltransferase domain-containing protein [Rubrivirga marina]|uniref:Arsenite methyltransferase n=1 Tax=Rubrivirga marina TaxID=1196024 RepID=A0A271IWQ8_9BACT|nr:methyltransferase domain-containing protein [Rubrivirga marina]PAP75560.1 methyltransferase type 11 [Rubrivirga marina]
MEPPTLTHDQVRTYYGQTLQSSTDLKTSACCSDEAVPEHHKPILSLLPDEVLTKFYGCGSPIPPALDGCTVLDLGCGTGRDAFVAAALAGPDGHVIGVDMTPEQIEVAQRHREAVADALGHETPTTDFRLGVIEDLGAIGIEDASVDVVISNCVLNLAPDKEAAFREITRVLRTGGELYFSDVFVDRRLPQAVRQDPVLVGECLGGALYTEDFRRLMARLGWADVRTVAESPIEVEDPALADKLGNARFVSRTIRAFKLPDLIEDRCEDYGQVAIYRGGVEGPRHAFRLDDHHLFEKDRPMLVCGNSAAMVQETRYGRFFEVLGDRSTHFGLFDCAPAPATGDAEASGGASCC